MKIAVVGPVYPYRGGIAHHTTMLLKTLARKHQVLSVSFSRQFPAWLYPGRSDQDPSASPQRVESEFLLDPLYPWTWWRAANYLHAQRPHLVIIQWWTTFWSPGFGVLARLLRQQGDRVFFLIHNVIPHEHHMLDRQLARFALAAADCNIVQSQREKVALEAILSGPRVYLAPFPLFDLFGGTRIPTSAARTRLGLPVDLPIILFFGLVRSYKGLRYLIDALAVLCGNGTRAMLVIAGEFWEDEQVYRRQIEANGLNERVVIFNSYVPDETVPILFSACDVLVAPYLAGTQSAAVNLAASYGVKIVKTTPIADSDLATAQGKGTWIVPPGNVPALADAVAQALNFPCQDSPLERVNGWDELAAVIESAA